MGSNIYLSTIPFKAGLHRDISISINEYTQCNPGENISISIRKGIVSIPFWLVYKHTVT